MIRIKVNPPSYNLQVSVKEVGNAVIITGPNTPMGEAIMLSDEEAIKKIKEKIQSEKDACKSYISDLQKKTEAAFNSEETSFDESVNELIERLS